MIDPLIGKTIGKYEIVAFVGRGATADVYKAYHPTLERYVAVKILHSFLSEDPDLTVRFQTEAKAAARLRHPNIVGVYDFDVLQGTFYLVMEFIEGVTLKAKLQELPAQPGGMPLDQAIHIATQVATGLAYAHKNGLVHRDIKPANIMLANDGQVILTDFGTAKIVGGLKHTASGVTVGTAAYASPEQVTAQPTDARSDLYSLGVVFFEMVTGQVPFQGETGVAVFLKHLTDPIPSPRELNPALSSHVETFIFKAMAKKPEERYASAEEFIEDLERLKSNSPLSQIKPAAVGTTTTVTVEINRYAAALSAATAATPPAGEYQLTPYALSPGNVAKQLSDLPSVCDKEWSRAVNQFSRRYIEQWLRDGVKRLRADHQHGLADDLEAIANRAEAIVSQIAEDDELGRNAALEEFLLSLGAVPSVVQFSPERLEFPTVGVDSVGRTITLTITNNGRGYLFGQVLSQVDWLEVRSSRFGCTAGKSANVFVQPKLEGIPAGIHEAANALQIRSAAGDLPIPAHINITPAILEVDTEMLDLGYVGQGDDALTTFMLRNRGAGFLVGSIETKFSWLQVWPKHFRVAAGQEVQITADIDSLKWPANVRQYDQILTIESNGGSAALGLRIHVDPPILKLDPPQVNWGALDLSRGLVNEKFDLKITNGGAGLLLGTLTPEENWLTIEPASFRCNRGQTQSIQCSILNLKTGDYRQMVHVASNAEDFELPVQARVVFSLEPETIRILPGPFWRGTPREQGNALEGFFRTLFPSSRTSFDYQPEQPQTEIYLTEYRIGKYPVTNAEYAVFIKTTGRRGPEHWRGGSPPPGLENYPVVNITWHQARAYCFWLSEVTGKTYQLPTEAQWEKAARGTDGRIFPWGNQWHKQFCNTMENNLRKTSEVGAFSPDGDSPYGCSDMVGNVWEWTLDWYGKDYYSRSTVTLDPLGPANGVVKVIRGGSFHTEAVQARTTSRLYANASNPSPEVGFRVAMKID